MTETFSVALTNVFAKAGPKGRMLIGGTMSSVREDLEEEKLLQKGMQLDYFLKHGALRWMHTPKSPKDDSPEISKVGKPLSVEKDVMIEGADGVMRKGTTFTAVLFKGNKTAEEIFSTAQAMAGEGAKWGVSVEGKIGSRVGPNGKTLATAFVTGLAIAPHPVNPDAFMQPLDLAKALTVAQIALDSAAIAPEPAVDPIAKATTTGSIEPVTVESRDGGKPRFTPKAGKSKDKKGKKDKKEKTMADIKEQLAGLSDDDLRAVLEPYRAKLAPVEDPEKDRLNKALTDADTILDGLSASLGVGRESMPVDADSLRDDVSNLAKGMSEIQALLPAQSEALVVFGNLTKALGEEMTAFRKETGARLAVLDDLNKALARPAQPRGVTAGVQPVDHPATAAATAAVDDVLTKAQVVQGLTGLMVAASDQGKEAVCDNLGRAISTIENDPRMSQGISKAVLNAQLKAFGPGLEV